MTYLLLNSEKRLKKSILDEKLNFVEKQNAVVIRYDNTRDLNNVLKISFIIKKIFFNFLIFFSKILIHKKRNKKNFLLFLKFYKYYNFFFFHNKMFFYKKYFIRKSYCIPYLDNFFLSKKHIKLKACLHRLKTKKISFYKKYIWNKTRKFRKKNILIFNKLFFKIFHSARVKPFIVDSILSSVKLKRISHSRVLRKNIFDLFHKRYYYLFLHKRYIFSRPKKKRVVVFWKNL